MRSKADLEKRLHALSHDLTLGNGEHAQDDDGALALGLRDLLVGACRQLWVTRMSSL